MRGPDDAEEAIDMAGAQKVNNFTRYLGTGRLALDVRSALGRKVHELQTAWNKHFEKEGWFLASRGEMSAGVETATGGQFAGTVLFMIPNALFNTEDIVTGTVTIPLRAWNGCGEAWNGANEYKKLSGVGECSGAIGEGMMLVIGPAEASGKTGPTLPSGKAIVGRLVAGGDSLFVRIFGEVTPELVPAGGPVPGRWFAAEVERAPTTFEARARGSGGQPPSAGPAAATPENAARPSLTATKEALAKVHAKVGKLPKGEPGKFGSPQAGTPKKGYRLDPEHPDAPPDSPETKPHINWWDYSEGKRGRGGASGAVPIEEGSE